MYTYQVLCLLVLKYNQKNFYSKNNGKYFSELKNPVSAVTILSALKGILCL